MNGEQFLQASGLQLCPDNQMPIITDRQGNFIAMKFDLAKAGNFYYVLNKYLNAMQGEAGYQLPVVFLMNSVPISMDNAQITIKGNSPKVTDNTIYAIPEVQSANGGISNIIFPMDIFRVPGKYSFIFQVNQNGNVYKTAPFILNVEPEMISISANFKNGVTPYDSVFDAWRANINKEFQVIQNEADNLQTLFDQYQAYADGIVSKQLANCAKTNTDNTFTGTQDFNNAVIDAGEIVLNGNNITHTSIKTINSVAGTFMNGVYSGSYATLTKLFTDTITLGVLSIQANIPNNSTMSSASESNAVPIVQFPSGSCAGLGETVLSASGAKLRFNVANSTLDFCGLTNTSMSGWGFAIRDVKVTITNVD